MKKVLLFSMMFNFLLINAQTQEKKLGIGLHFGTIQYQGDYGSEFFKYQSAHPAGMLSIARYINHYWDVEGNVSNGLLDFSWTDANNGIQSFEGNLTNLDFLLKFKFNNGKILSEKSVIAPYLFFGIGDGFYKNKNFFPESNDISLNFPLGGGIRFNFTSSLALDVRCAYHYSLTDYYDGISPINNKWQDQFLTSTVGLVFNLGKKDTDKDGVSDKLDACANTPEKVDVDFKGCPKDKDKDGVPDYQDKCPEVAGNADAMGCPDKDLDGVMDKDDLCPEKAGIASLGGCPDKDGDGIQDDKDNCPEVAGLVAFNGCPDSDGDGVIDSEDACPKEKGAFAMKGCPDGDNDGVSDKDDKCPKVAGTLANKGCPEVSKEVTKVLEQALKGVQFESGKDIIKPTSFGILDNVVTIMKNNPEYKLLIDGHTDNQGDDQKNLTLSQNRANAVKKYIADKGVEAQRMTATGYGETKPVDTNETAPGRAKNRRVEFKIEF